MTTEEKLKEQYTELCQTLGNLTLQKENLDEQVQEVKQNIKSLLSFSHALISNEKSEESKRDAEEQSLKEKEAKILSLLKQNQQLANKLTEVLSAEPKCAKCSCNAGPDSN